MGIIVLAVVKIVRGEAEYDFYRLLRVQLYPKLDENACDYILIILFHDLYHETAYQERLAKYYYAISALALHLLFLSRARVCAICQLDVKHFMFQSDLFSTRRLDYFSLAVLNNCLLCSDSSAPLIF